jgi:hypothetical protein
LIGAPIGQLLGPLAVDGGFAVVAVLVRAAPDLDDHRVVTRARRAAIDRATRQAAREHVKF